jgi:phytanoyl-CoA dioxygenase PhyH
MKQWSWRQDEPSTETGIDDLARDGFSVIPCVLDDTEVHRLQVRIKELAEAERQDGTAWFSHGNQRIFNLLNKGQVFIDLIEHPASLAVARRVLGPCPLLSSITANLANPGNSPQQLHADQQYITEPWTYPATLQVVWMIDDFTADNGGTRVVPRTHILGRAPVTENIETVPIVGPAGSIALLDGRVWHGSGVNTSLGSVRRGIFAYYCMPFLRQQENVFRSLDPLVRSKLSAQARSILGYDAWEGLGVVDGIPREWMNRSGSRTGPVNTDNLFPGS